MDYKTLHPDSNTDDRYLLLLVDLLTKYVWYKCTLGKPAAGVADFVQERFVEWKAMGYTPKILHTDNGGEFKNALVEAVCKEHNVEVRHGLPGHPQAQGAIERVVQTFWRELRKRDPNADMMEPDYDWVSQYVATTNSKNSNVTAFRGARCVT